MGLAGAFGSGGSVLSTHQLDAPAAPAAPAPEGVAGKVQGAAATDASSAIPGSDAAGAPASPVDATAPPAPGDAPAAGAPSAPLAAPEPEPWSPAPALGLPVAASPLLVEQVQATLAAALAAQAGSPHDALLAATGSTSGLGLAATPAVGGAVALGEAGPGTPLGTLDAAGALVSGDFDVRDDLQRPLLEALQATGLQPKKAVGAARDLTPGSLERAILRLYAASGIEASLDQRARLHDDALGLDADLTHALTILVSALAEGQEKVQAAMTSLAPEDYQLLWDCTQPTDDPWGQPCADPFRAAKVAREQLDQEAMAKVALSLLAAVEQAQPMLDAFRESALMAATSHGGDDKDLFADPTRLIQVGGYGNDVYYGNNLLAEPVGGAGSSDSYAQLLTLDFSGEDLYLARAGGTSPDPLTVGATGPGSLAQGLLPHTDHRSFGLGTFVSLTIDYAGNDAYSGGVNYQGAGRLGVGILLDLAGDDQYTAASSSQAAGDAGIGLLYDAAGNDAYSSQYRSQGYGTVGGLGLLLDQGGDDSYTGVILMQGAGSNQGTGMLLEVAGNDRYSAMAAGPTASQGGSNLIGIGVFADGLGFDTYSSSSVAQGMVNPAPAPYGAGTALFLDRGGIDTYSTTNPGHANGGTWSAGNLGYGRDAN